MKFKSQTELWWLNNKKEFLKNIDELNVRGYSIPMANLMNFPYWLDKTFLLNRLAEESIAAEVVYYDDGSSMIYIES